MLTRKCARMYVDQVLTETQYSPRRRHTESNHPCHSTRPNPSLGNGEAPNKGRRRSGLVTLPKGPILTGVPSEQAISTKTFPLLATMKLSSSMPRTLVLCGGLIAPNGCSSRTAVGGQRFGSLLRGESLVARNYDGLGCRLTAWSYPIYGALQIP